VLLAAAEIASAAPHLPRAGACGFRRNDNRESGEGWRGRDAARFKRRRSAEDGQPRAPARHHFHIVASV
jgi:hypothetical protein